jgi:1-acyl-sn-glycerol-3-phosphate acyltransferase
MLKTARVIFRLLVLSLWTASVYVVWQPGMWMTRPWASRQLQWRTLIFRTWARGFANVLHMRVRVRGQRPQSPFLLVTNHLSYVDIILLASQLGCVFISRHDVERWPVIGHLTTKMGTIYIDRNARKDVVRVSEAIAAALGRGEGVTLFAEGTSTCGARVLPFKTSLLEIAVRSRQPVHYGSLSYRTNGNEMPAHLSVCWWGDMAFFAHVLNLLQVSHFEAEIVFGAETLLETDRKALAKKLHERISLLFTPVAETDDLC